MEGGEVGNILCVVGLSWLWDMESSKESISSTGFVLLVFCWWAGYLGIRESYIRKKHPKQAEHGNCPLVIGPWEGTPGSDSIYTYQGPQALPSPQSKSPHTEGIATVTQWSAVSASLPWALTTGTQERKRAALFFKWIRARSVIGTQGDKLSLLLQGPSLEPYLLIPSVALSFRPPLPSST